jgi:hypothetical protein
MSIDFKVQVSGYSALFSTKPGFLQSDRGLVRRDIKDKPLCLAWKARATAACYELTNLVTVPRAKSRDRKGSSSTLYRTMAWLTRPLQGWLKSQS